MGGSNWTPSGPPPNQTGWIVAIIVFCAIAALIRLGAELAKYQQKHPPRRRPSRPAAWPTRPPVPPVQSRWQPLPLHCPNHPALASQGIFVPLSPAGTCPECATRPTTARRTVR